MLDLCLGAAPHPAPRHLAVHGSHHEAGWPPM